MKVHHLFESRPRSTDDGNHGWEKSKWWPAKFDAHEQSPTKMAFSAMVIDAIKTWPSPIREYFHRIGVGVGGNSIFDCISGVMYEFEDAESEYDSIPLESFHKDIVKLGASLKEYHTKLAELDSKLEALSKRRFTSLDDYKAAVSKLRAPVAVLGTSGGKVHVSLTCTEPKLLQLKVREAKYERGLKKVVPGEDMEYMPRNSMEEFSFDPDRGLRMLFDVILHLVGWTEVLGIHEPVSIEVKAEPMTATMNDEHFADVLDQLPLTDAEKKALIKDYKEWSGGFHPNESPRHADEADAPDEPTHDGYIEHALDKKFAGRENTVRRFLNNL